MLSYNYLLNNQKSIYFLEILILYIQGTPLVDKVIINCKKKHQL